MTETSRLAFYAKIGRFPKIVTRPNPGAAKQLFLPALSPSLASRGFFAVLNLHFPNALHDLFFHLVAPAPGRHPTDFCMRYLYPRVAEVLFLLVFLLFSIGAAGALPARNTVQPQAAFEPVLPDCDVYTVFCQNLSSGDPTLVEWFAPGASPGYSTEYHPTLTFPGPGIYTVTLVASNADGADTTNRTITLSGSTFGYFTQAICEEQSVEVGGQIFDIDNTSGAVLLPGANSNGCDSTVLVTLFVLPPAQFNLDVSIPAGGSFTFCGQPLQNAGVYFCSVQNSQGCDTLFILHLDIAVGTDEAARENAFTAAPNPFTDELIVDWPEAIRAAGTVELVNATGVPVYRGALEKGQDRLHIPAGRLPVGVYALLWRSDGKIQSRKVVKL